MSLANSCNFILAASLMICNFETDACADGVTCSRVKWALPDIVLAAAGVTKLL